MMTALRRGSLLSVALLFLVSTACNTEQAAAPSAVTQPAAVVAPSGPLVPVAQQQDLLGGLVGGLTKALGITANGVLRTSGDRVAV